LNTARRPRVLFDTSALFGAEHRRSIARLVDRDIPAFTPLWSEWIIGELYYGLAWRWAEKTVAAGNGLTDEHRRDMGRAAKAMLMAMLPLFELVSLHGAPPFATRDFIPDEDDLHLYEAAIRGGATTVVLNDGPLLRAYRKASGWGTIELTQPDRFFASFESDLQEPLEPDEA